MHNEFGDYLRGMKEDEPASTRQLACEQDLVNLTGLTGH